MTKEVKLKIDGREVTVPADWTLIKACRQNGIAIPHLCYHPDLSIPGNCRICMVGIKGFPHPVPACAQPVAEGMEVSTSGKDVEEARKSVMEFLLINHPLDCPECDQSGECKLQNYSHQFGRDHGRFHGEKVRKSKATFGPHVKYWGSRCILCSRCVRFTEEVSGQGELGIVYRGDHAEIALFSGRNLDNPLSMNTVDICPVGALVSSDFLFQARVWNLHSRPSVCSDCAVGCNTRVDLDAKNRIKRIVPRRNDAVNKEWMCDRGRLSFGYTHENRLQKPKLRGQDATWKEARRAALELLSAPGSAALISAWNTNETMQSVKEFLNAEFPSIPVFGYGGRMEPDLVFPGFTISGDKNPNRAGMKQVLKIDPAASFKDLAASHTSIGTLLLVHNVPDFELTAEFKSILDRCRNVVLLDFAAGDLLRYGNVAVALPTTTVFEKSGTFVNRHGLPQTFYPVMEPVTYGMPETEIMAAMRNTVSAVVGANVGAHRPSTALRDHDAPLRGNQP